MTVAITNNNQGAAVWPVKNGLAPRKGPKALPQTVTFTAAITQIELDLKEYIDAEALDFIQSIAIDNTQNPYPFEIRNAVTQQTLKVKAYAQATLPVLSVSSVFIMSSYGGLKANAAINVNLHFLSMMQPSAVWQACADGSIGQDYSSAKPALLANLLATLPANKDRQEFEYQNQSANMHQVVMDDGQGNNVSILLMDAGVNANDQGSAYKSNTEKGRVRIYSSAPNDQMFLRER